jgi:hypothetical protein
MFVTQLDIQDDGFLSLMSEDGNMKDDVKVPEGEIGQKIEKLFRDEEKDTSAYYFSNIEHNKLLTVVQTSSSLPPWARRPPSTPRRLLVAPTKCFLPS